MPSFVHRNILQTYLYDGHYNNNDNNNEGNCRYIECRQRDVGSVRQMAPRQRPAAELFVIERPLL